MVRQTLTAPNNINVSNNAQVSRVWTTPSSTLRPTLASPARTRRVSTLTWRASVRPGTCVSSQTGSGASSALMGQSSIRRSSLVSGGLTLTAAQLRVSTASMLTSTVRPLSAVTPAEGEDLQAIEGHKPQAEARAGHLVAVEVKIRLVNNVYVKFICI